MPLSIRMWCILDLDHQRSGWMMSPVPVSTALYTWSLCNNSGWWSQVLKFYCFNINHNSRSTLDTTKKTFFAMHKITNTTFNSFRYLIRGNSMHSKATLRSGYESAWDCDVGTESIVHIFNRLVLLVELDLGQHTSIRQSSEVDKWYQQKELHHRMHLLRDLAELVLRVTKVGSLIIISHALLMGGVHNCACANQYHVAHTTPSSSMTRHGRSVRDWGSSHSSLI